MNKLEVGDKVILNSGSIIMVINSMDRKKEFCTCCYYDEKDNKRFYFIRDINLKCLTKV